MVRVCHYLNFFQEQVTNFCLFLCLRGDSARVVKERVFATEVVIVILLLKEKEREKQLDNVRFASIRTWDGQT